MAIAIRDVRSEDLEQVLDLNEAAVPHVNRVDLSRMHRFHAEAAYFRVALIDDRLSAFLVGMTPEADYDSPNFRWFCAKYADFAYIDRVAVAAAARRCGLAAALYHDFRATVGTGRARLACEVNLRPPNDASMNFHLRMGFRRVGSQIIDAGRKEVAMLIRDLATREGKE